MFKNIQELYSLLTVKQRKQLIVLQVLVVIMSLLEVVSVVSIGPFMALVSDMGLLEREGIIAYLFKTTSLEKPQDFVLFLGGGVLILLLIASVVSMFTVWRLSMFGSQIGADLGNRLYEYYMYQEWLYHVRISSSTLTNKISQETARVTNQIIHPLMLINAKLVLAVLMVSTVFYINPYVAAAGVTIFFAAYFILYKVVKNKLASNGENITNSQALRFKLMSEGFGGIKDVLLLGRQPVFVDRFVSSSQLFAYSQADNVVLQQVPRYAMELVAFSSVIGLVLYLLIVQQGNLTEILPLLSVYALAGFKILPAFQQIYGNITKVRGNLAGFENIKGDLEAAFQKKGGSSSAITGSDVLHFENELELKKVNFKYPGKEEAALKDLSLTIPVNKVVGFVGSSGSGKSTVIDLLLGLIAPDDGHFLIDGEQVLDGNKRAWQNNIGFVPQSIFLSDSSIMENIAFGLALESIDEERVKQAASMAHLTEFLDNLPHGLHTNVGERGIQLSGGQRQRIGIARALYSNADVLVLDEATSALDGVTEKAIMEAIHDLSGRKTILMIAHRLATVKKCDVIYFLDGGRVVEQGSYKELVEKSAMFRRMAEHA